MIWSAFSERDVIDFKGIPQADCLSIHWWTNPPLPPRVIRNCNQSKPKLAIRKQLQLYSFQNKLGYLGSRNLEYGDIGRRWNGCFAKDLNLLIRCVTPILIWQGFLHIVDPAYMNVNLENVARPSACRTGVCMSAASLPILL